MSLFLATLGLGLGGLLLMALPGMRRHGHVGHARAHARAHGHAAVHTRSHARAGAQAHAPVKAHAAAHQHHAPVVHQGAQNGLADRLMHYVPEPRLIFSLLALFGAFGNVLQHAAHLPFGLSALGAAGISVFLEWAIVGRLWRLALKFTGAPTSSLGALLLDQAEAVTAFHNGKGIVSAVLDGRAVQLTAELMPEERELPVRVGDRMTIQEVDQERRRVRVSVR